jgi:hypothetical protein
VAFYRLLAHALSRLALLVRSDAAKDVVILVLRHDVRPHSPALRSDHPARATRKVVLAGQRLID